MHVPAYVYRLFHSNRTNIRTIPQLQLRKGATLILICINFSSVYDRMASSIQTFLRKSPTYLCYCSDCHVQLSVNTNTYLKQQSPLK